DLDGTISYASPSVASFSYPQEALVGRPLMEFVHPEDVAAARTAVQEVLSQAEDVTPAAPGGAPEPADGGTESRAEARVDGRTEGRADGHADAGGTSPEGKDRFSCRLRAADGTWRHLECAVLLYRLPGEPAQMLVTARDVSDQVALRQQVT